MPDLEIRSGPQIDGPPGRFEADLSRETGSVGLRKRAVADSGHRLGAGEGRRFGGISRHETEQNRAGEGRPRIGIRRHLGRDGRDPDLGRGPSRRTSGGRPRSGLPTRGRALRRPGAGLAAAGTGRLRTRLSEIPSQPPPMPRPFDPGPLALPVLPRVYPPAPARRRPLSIRQIPLATRLTKPVPRRGSRGAEQGAGSPTFRFLNIDEREPENRRRAWGGPLDFGNKPRVALVRSRTPEFDRSTAEIPRPTRPTPERSPSVDRHRNPTPSSIPAQRVAVAGTRRSVCPNGGWLRSGGRP